MSGRKPHFLEVYLPNLSSERLRVPSKFVKHLGGRTSGSVSLTGPSGYSWRVELVEHNDHLFLADGWFAFVMDHSIECGDTLVFRYDGNLRFTVQIFDQTSCEKEAALYSKCSLESSYCNEFLGQKRGREKEDASLEKKRRGSLMPNELDLLRDTKHESDIRDSKLRPTVRNGCGDTTNDSDDDYETPIVSALPAFGSGQMTPLVRNACSNKKVSEFMKAWKEKKKSGTQKKPESEHQKKLGISNFIESRAAQYFTSSFPYFVRVMKYSNVSDRGTLKIPTKFSMAHFPNSRTKVIIRNLNGDSWALNSIPTVRLHSTFLHTLSGGWLAFVRGNCLKLKDICIFELVGKFEMLVRILRLGLEELDENISFDVSTARSPDFCPAASESELVDTNEVYGPKSLEEEKENSTQIKESKETSEMLSGTQYQAVSTIDGAGYATVLEDTENSVPSPESRTYNKSTDQSLEGHSTESRPYQTRSRQEARNKPLTSEEALTALSFSSPFPSFLKVLMHSNVGGSYSLAVPRKFANAHLPTHKGEIVLRNLKRDSWNVTCCRYGLQLKLCAGWMAFVRQNELKMGDICVFELVDDMVLQVHIFKADQMALDIPTNGSLQQYSTTSMNSTACAVLPET